MSAPPLPSPSHVLDVSSMALFCFILQCHWSLATTHFLSISVASIPGLSDSLISASANPGTSMTADECSFLGPAALVPYDFPSRSHSSVTLRQFDRNFPQSSPELGRARTARTWSHHRMYTPEAAERDTCCIRKRLRNIWQNYHQLLQVLHHQDEISSAPPARTSII